MNVRELLKNGALAGAGALSLAREKAGSVADELVKRGQSRRDEAAEFVDRLTVRGEDEREALRKMVKEEIERGLHAMNLATGKDVEAVAKEIDALRTRLEG